MKVLVIGASWMLAHDFISSESKNFELVTLRRDDCDITDTASISQALQEYHPDVVLNCAAYTAVDDAEDIWAFENYSVNVLWNYYLAKECGLLGIDLIMISTDYVFWGTKDAGYFPTDEPHPVNAYGMAKFLGEKLVRDVHPNSIIIRTSWLYGGGTQFKNFVNTILRLAASRSELRVVADQYGAPTNALDLSRAIGTVIRDIPVYRGKTFHFSNETESIRGISWFDFAQEILRISDSKTDVFPVPSIEYPTKAKRPAESHLLNDSGIRLAEWRVSLSNYLTSSKNSD